MSVITILLALGIIVFVVGQQVVGSSVSGRRLILLPAILTIIGIVDVTGHKAHASGTDFAIIAAGAALAAGIGLALGAITRLERRNGHLWAQLPTSGIALWVVFIVGRVALMAVAHGVGAHVAASTDAILLTLGINRIAQAAVVTARAVRDGIPFAPEKDGQVFAGGLFH